MSRLSSETQTLLADLVMWECMGMQAIDPKITLRQLPLTDLSILMSNIEEDGSQVPSLDKFVVIKMVKVELLYRQGRLKGDWSYLRLDQRIRLRYSVAPDEVMDSVHDIEPSEWATA